MNLVNAIAKKELNGEVNMVTFTSAETLKQDTYYFSAGGTLPYHRHPNGDQIFFIQEGTGTFYIDDANGEEGQAVKPGDMILAPKNVWHKLVADEGCELIASQVTSQGAGKEDR
ncbi:MAG: cupin domain-containing protein [Nitrospinae bacterium]|nr:cupin domain-containing protein [Nitrospinota bacterium]